SSLAFQPLSDFPSNSEIQSSAEVCVASEIKREDTIKKRAPKRFIDFLLTARLKSSRHKRCLGPDTITQQSLIARAIPTPNNENSVTGQRWIRPAPKFSHFSEKTNGSSARLPRQ